MKPVAGIVRGVAYNDYDAVAKIAAGIESFFNQCGTNPKTLVIRVYHKRCEGDSRSRRPRGFDGDGRKHDMSDYPVTTDGNKR